MEHYLLFAVSLSTGVASPFYLGYSGLAFILVMMSSATLLLFLGIGIISHSHPSTIRPKRSFGETDLNLAGKTRREEDNHRAKN
jgi:hypothetical protein